jgi:hypothetical protein
VLEGIAEEDVDHIADMFKDDEDIDSIIEPIPVDEDVIPPFEDLIGFMLGIVVEDDMGRDIDIDMLDDVLLRLGLSPGLFPPIGVAVAVKVDVGCPAPELELELEELTDGIYDEVLDFVLPADIGIEDVNWDIEPPPFGVLDIDI